MGELNRIDAAVVGCGRMGAFTSEAVRRFAPACWLPLAHAEAVRAHPGLVLRALADSDAAARERAARAWDVTATFTDARSLCDALRPTLLCVATRTPGRADIVAHAVASGTRALHVEKPLCNSMAELAALDSLLAHADLFVTFGAIRRLLAPYRAALQVVHSGRLGALLEVRVDFGPGALYWTHPHGMDLLLWAAGGAAVESVAARLEGVERAGTTVESDPRVVSATVVFAGGVVGRITRAAGSDVTLACERGSVCVENDGHAVVVHEAGGADPYPRRHALDVGATLAAAGLDAARAPGGTLAALALLVDALRGDAAAAAQAAAIKRDLLAGQRLLFACVQSHLEDGRPIAPGAVDPSLAVHAGSGGRFA
jgi:predicted dehydrogenase